MNQLVIPFSRESGLTTTLKVRPTSASWPTWVEITDRFAPGDMVLVAVDINGKGVQLTFQRI